MLCPAKVEQLSAAGHSITSWCQGCTEVDGMPGKLMLIFLRLYDLWGNLHQYCLLGVLCVSQGDPPAQVTYLDSLIWVRVPWAPIGKAVRATLIRDNDVLRLYLEVARTTGKPSVIL